MMEVAHFQLKVPTTYPRPTSLWWLGCRLDNPLSTASLEALTSPLEKNSNTVDDVNSQPDVGELRSRVAMQRTSGSEPRLSFGDGTSSARTSFARGSTSLNFNRNRVTSQRTRIAQRSPDIEELLKMLP